MKILLKIFFDSKSQTMHNLLPTLTYANYTIRLLDLGDAETVTNFYLLNQDHLAPYENILREYTSKNYWQAKVLADKEDFWQGRSCCLGIFINSELIGMINFRNIIGGFFQSCSLGYKISAEHQGQGIMQNCLRIAINYVFNELNLHRISASYMPSNIRSAKLLESLGFKQEGLATKYLYINGMWQDHILTALINNNWQYNLKL
jgi:ribosomal-protein-alanine N-acetyltransferase